ncbi:hypothetical protein H4582DRAFT_1124328 [Lactarius indigo]|nr:hypothetical protein H4582DRAFT_1124328 [Lactarius indigo]
MAARSLRVPLPQRNKFALANSQTAQEHKRMRKTQRSYRHGEQFVARYIKTINAYSHSPLLVLPFMDNAYKFHFSSHAAPIVHHPPGPFVPFVEVLQAFRFGARISMLLPTYKRKYYTMIIYPLHTFSFNWPNALVATTANALASSDSPLHSRSALFMVGFWAALTTQGTTKVEQRALHIWMTIHDYGSSGFPRLAPNRAVTCCYTALLTRHDFSPPRRQPRL